MVEFPSQEYCDIFKQKLNENPAYKKAAENWEGDMMYIIEGEDNDLPAGENVIIYMDLWHGDCNSAKILFEETEKPGCEYKVRGPESTWKKVNSGEAEPIQLIMTQQLKVEGDLNKIMKATKAAIILAQTAASIPMDYMAQEKFMKMKEEHLNNL